MSRPVRYTFILALVALGTCLAAVSGWRYARASAPVNGPIILMSIDALRADALPAYGAKKVETPTIDALAADGVVFERAYAHVPQTFPAHAALLTGRLPSANGVRDNVGFTLKPAERTLPEMLRDRGYATAGVVSSFLLRAESGIGQGFELYDAELSSEPAAALSGLTRDGAATEKVAEHWFDSVGTSRAFLFLHVSDLLDRSESSDGSPRDTYDRQIAHTDEIIGRLIRYLKAHQLYDRSTIILLADHGEGLGDHGEDGHGLFTYEEALRIPLIVKQPGGEGAGRRIKDVVRHVDIVPTILDLAKAPVPGNLDGRSLTALLEGGRLSPVLAYSESLYARYHFGWSALLTITDGRYRYISAPRPELYDLDGDPGERENIADAHPELAAELRKALDQFTATGPLANMAPVSRPDLERFEALGSVGTFADALTSKELLDPKDGVDAVERYRAAVHEVASGNLEGAIERFRSLARDKPAMADVWMHLGAVAMRAERYEVAAEAFTRASVLRPGGADAHLGAASALLPVRKFDEVRQQAATVLETAHVLPSDKAAAHDLLARVALARRDVEAARSHAVRAEEADPSRPSIAILEGRIAFDRKHYADALEALEPSLVQLQASGDRSVSELRLLTAESMLAVERFPEAEYLFLEQLKQTPRSARARGGLTAVYKATGRTTEAAGLAATH